MSSQARKTSLLANNYVIGPDPRLNLAPKPVFPTPAPTPTMVNLEASSSHAGPISEPLKVRPSSEKRIL